MPWWLALLNTVVATATVGAALIALARPQLMLPAGAAGDGESYYAAMYAARAVPLGLAAVAVVWIPGAHAATILVLAAAAAAQVGDVVIGLRHRSRGMAVGAAFAAVCHAAGALAVMV